MASEPIRSTTITAAPKDYSIPNAQQIRLLSVTAEFIDNGAAGDWLPAVVILDNNGNALCRAVDQAVKVTAGSDAEVSWFPGVKNAAAATGATTIGWGTLQVLPLTTVQSYAEFPDPSYNVPFDFTNHSFHEDGSGIFSFNAANPTELVVNPPVGGILHLGASFRHTPTVDLVADTDIAAFIAANGTAYQPPIGTVFDNSAIVSARRATANPDVNPPRFTWFQLRETVFTGNQVLPTGWSLVIENLGNSGVTLDASQASIWGYFIG